MAYPEFRLFSLGHDWLYLLHGKCFGLRDQQFEWSNYCGIGKLCNLVFNLAPYIDLFSSEHNLCICG
ncbi:DUF6868 family protein [Paraglaciecola arctica]|uniref:DUF6868 domain-containing protein n=1 Tax=Paraglaciecola arctica BSs20135 TaxID=493475 RepID=K6YV31_9ALTE|nr:hypothetical protein GARC_5097 [Paraglaciecola arctica BSs20135]